MKAIFVLLFSGLAIQLFAQWSTSGNDIYNSNIGNVGIGTSIPTVKLEVNGGGALDVFNLTNESNSLGLNAQVSSNTHFHASAFTGKRSRGTMSNPLDVQAGDRLTGFYSSMFVNGIYRTSAAIQFYAGSSPSSLSYPSNIRFETTSNGSTTRVERMRISENGDVGIGFTVPSAKLDVNGSIRATSFVTTSDQRFKHNVKHISNALNKLSNIDGVTYEFRVSSFPNRQFSNGEKMGLIAQQVKEIFPNSVMEDSDGYLAVDYLSLIPIMIESIKELNVQLNAYKDSMSIDLIIDSDQFEEPISSRGIVNSNLKQNVPNPYDKTSVIEYAIPRDIQSALILIHNLKGEEIKRYIIDRGGNGKIEISDGDLSSGFYLYTLVVDGIGISTKKMIHSK